MPDLVPVSKEISLKKGGRQRESLRSKALRSVTIKVTMTNIKYKI